MKVSCRLITLTLILLTSMMVFSYSGKEIMAAPDVAPDSVLNIIPQDTVGVIYIPSLLGLNDEINALMAELIPTDPPQEVPAQILAETFGAGFETLEELEELGLDLQRNFAVFLSGVNPLMYSAAVHVKDADSVKQLIEMEAEGSSSFTHNGVTYYTTGEEGAFVLMDDVMVYSGSAAVCEKVIDTQKKAMPSIADTTDFQSLKLDTTSGTNDVVAYFAMDAIADALRPTLTEKAEELKTDMKASAETDPELSSGLGQAESVIDGGLWLLDQSKTLSLTVQLNGTDLQISPFLKFKGDSEIQTYISQMPGELTHLKHLPQNAFLNGEMQFQKEMLIELTQAMMQLIIPSGSNADTAKIEEATAALTEAAKGFYAGLGDEFAFSLNFGSSLMPDFFYIYDVTDEARVKAYMENDFTEYLGATMGLMQAMGGTQEIAGMYSDVSAGPSEIYNGVEIKSYIMPNIDALFAELPPGMEGVAPEQWNIYYAINGGKMLYAMAGNAQPVKNTIDRMAGMGAGFDQGAGYAKLTGALTLKNNMFFALSPITAVKNLVQIFAQMDPNIGMVQMFLVNIPETYSIGIASQNRDQGVAGELFISLGDFREIIVMIISLQQMGGMQ
ncbi:hypothetical protein C6502_11150 [Candidatus Poribacteria bacterium]|nr:MAG: hypothetical protein C6502_11150 [Candidatus Poribacteria bacterium]